ncbi:MAG: DEAD/DEAH box helicase [bacterium]|nr:DEAD/DEAH box helicase [bacterium]
MNAQALRARLPRSWGAFFGRYGSFTPIQLQAIPPLLDGLNVLLRAGTASGKTEAALAPLIERHLPADRPDGQLTLLYILPTRALINDLASRLAAPLGTLRITWGIKTRDINTFNPRQPVDFLLLTPESLDSLMASDARSLIHVRAVVIDELHTFDSSVRGDQLRIVLRRLDALRTYAASRGDTEGDSIQFAALSATLRHPEVSAGRYFGDAQIATDNQPRRFHLEVLDLDPAEPRALLECLQTFRERGWKKALIFCNTRAEVEQYAAYTRTASTPFGGAVYVHYSNLERERRREIETQFAHAEAAICFASSTLELGIDIGSIDAVLLIGAPGSAEAFIQRIGRANRRQKIACAVGFCRSPLEHLLFKALTRIDDGAALPTPFRPSVAIQQIFSLLKASPSGSIRLNPTVGLFAGLLHRADVEAILGELQARGYLKAGRDQEWRAGEQLNRLIDLQAADRAPLSLYSNLKMNAPTVKIRDRNTHRVVARLDRLTFEQDKLLLEGHKLNVEWIDGEALWVSMAFDDASAVKPIYRSVRPVLSYSLARALMPALGLTPESAPLIAADEGWLWFHCLGDLYGQAVLDLLRYTLPAEPSAQLGLCLLLSDELYRLPTWSVSDVTRYLVDRYRVYERMLDLGAYHTLLPTALRRQAVIEQFDVEGFVEVVRALRLEYAPETLKQPLFDLLQVPR